MPAARYSGALDDAPQPSYAVILAPVRAFSALSIACPECSALPDETCSGPRICKLRLSMAVELARAGKLAEADPVVRRETDSCPDRQGSGFNPPPQQRRARRQLTEDDRADIRRMYNGGKGLSQRQIADQYGVHQTHVGGIVRSGPSRRG